MKKTKELMGLALIILVSCSQDSNFFVDFESESQYLSNDLLTTWQDSTYLDMKESYFGNFTDEDWKVYMEAESRLSFVYSEKGQCSIIQKSGKEVNISDKLFEDIKRNVVSSNKMIKEVSNNRKILTRRTNRNVEPGLIGNDCVGQCIADYCNADLDYVNQTISQHYPQYASGCGIPLDMLLDVVRLFKSNADWQDKFWSTNIFFGEKDIEGILALYGHAVVADKFKYIYSSNTYKIWGHDPQNNVNFESPIYKNEVPARTESGGSIVIFKYVK